MMLWELTTAGVVLMDQEDIAAYGGWLAAVDVNERGRRSVRIWPTDEVDGFRNKRNLGRLLLNASDEFIVDHVNRNSLDYRKHNLRLATLTQNSYNRSKASHNTSGYKGVSWHKRSKNYQARITIKGVLTTLGSSVDPVIAAKLYDEAAKKHFGEFAVLNFPGDLL